MSVYTQHVATLISSYDILSKREPQYDRRAHARASKRAIEWASKHSPTHDLVLIVFRGVFHSYTNTHTAPTERSMTLVQKSTQSINTHILIGATYSQKWCKLTIALDFVYIAAINKSSSQQKAWWQYARRL